MTNRLSYPRKEVILHLLCYSNHYQKPLGKESSETHITWFNKSTIPCNSVLTDKREIKESDATVPSGTKELIY